MLLIFTQKGISILQNRFNFAKKLLRVLYEQHFNNIILYKLKDIQLNKFRIVASIRASFINDWNNIITSINNKTQNNGSAKSKQTATKLHKK